MEEKEFEEKAIPLITEGFDLETDGIEFLQKLSDKNIAVISIIGPVSSGKSFLATQMSDKINKGFEISSPDNKECCTKGIWVWGKPLIKDNYYIIILDAQGLRIDTEENLEYSQKIFALCTLISSIVIYNYKNDETKEGNKLSNEVIEQSYKLFNKMIQFLPKIKLEDNEELSEEMNKITSSHLPEFLWIYRDSTTTDFNAFNELEKNFLEKNEYFKTLFKNKIKKYSLPCPMDLNKMKSNSYLNISEDEIKSGGPFSQEYKTTFNNLKNKIIHACTPKVIKNLTLNGNLFYGLLQEYASAIFSGDYMFVESPLSNVVFSNLGEITESITETFKEKLEEKNNEVYDIIQIMKNAFEVFSDGLLNEYQNNFIGKLIHSQFMTEEMNNILSSVSDEVLDTNINEKLTQFNDSLKELTEKESSEKTGKIEAIPDIKKNLNEFANKIQKEIEENIFKKENEFLNSFGFIKDYIIKCICNKINSYADSIQFYVEHNLQTVESSSKTNEEAFEAKIQELNEKENELNKLKIELEKMKQNMKDKEKEYQNNVLIENKKYINLKDDYEKILKEKNLELKKLEDKNNEINQEIRNIFMERNNKDDLSKIKNENMQLKVDLGIKEKQLNALTSKLKDLEEKKRKQSSIQEEMDNNILKESDIPKLKEMFKAINKTITEYSEKINNLEKNKKQVFHDKFIEQNKSDWKKTYNNWNEELNQFKEDHFKTMENNYSHELSELKKENSNLINELKSLFNEVDAKNIEIMKLTQKINSDKEIFDIKKKEIKDILEKNDKMQKEMEIFKVRLAETEKQLKTVENNLGNYKYKANMIEEQVDYILRLIQSMTNKNKKLYFSLFNKMQDEYKKVFQEFNKAFNIIK